MKKHWAYAMRYDDLGASSRIRHQEWAARMLQAGYQVTWQHFFSNSYLRKLYSGKGRSRTAWIAGIIFRAFWLLFKAPRNLVVEYELFPYIPWCIERLFWFRRKVVLDFDDDVGVRYKNNPFLRGKFDKAAARAQMVITANDRLYDNFSKFNKNVVKIPTLIDLPPKNTADKFPSFTIVWIGTPVTYCYIEKFADILQKMAAKTDFELLIVSSKNLEKRSVPNVRMHFIDWSPSAAAIALASAHAGIMPLTDDEFSNGKSAYKLIQYMGAGIPAIASGVGENKRVVRHGISGFIADTADEWSEALNILKKDSFRREEMGAQAYALAREYTYDHWFPFYENVLMHAFFDVQLLPDGESDCPYEKRQ